MYIDVVPNRNSPPAILLRESYRVDGKVKKRTLLNITDWPSDLIEGFRALLKGGTALPPGQDAIVIKRSLPHGHVAAVLGTLRKIGFDRLLGPVGNGANRCRDLIVAMIVARLIAPLSKLATAKALDPITAASSLGEVLGLGPVDEDELYTALDWLLERQPQIEAALARRHLKNGTLCCMTSHRAILRGAAVHSLNSASIATASAASCRSSTACCALPMGARWRSRCSKVQPETPARWRSRSTRSSSGSSSATWCSSAIAA